MDKNNTPWKILTRAKILHTSVFDIYEEKAVCPRNGEPGDFFVIDCPNSWVNVVALTPDNELVMIKQYRHGSKRFELEVPGGLVEPGELPEHAGLRELREETGFVGGRHRVIGKVCPNPALQGNWCYTVLVEDAVKRHDTSFDAGEDIETILVPVHEIDGKINDGIITHGIVLNALLFYKQLLV
ncbi:MAG: NUDIX hydrolase [bacterium]|nr:NUDIX hydrolase [bacterium]